jgi:hypothetical protein
MMTGENQNDIEEYPLDSKKVSGIISSKKGVNIKFTSDVDREIHISFKRLVLDYEMLLDSLNFSRNSIVRLPRGFINSFKAESLVNTHVANDFINIATDILARDLTIF